jgi:hypothetical protein
VRPLEGLLYESTGENTMETRSAAAAVAALLILPASAPAATVAVVPGGDDAPTVLQYRAAAGEANKLDVKVAADGRSAEISDPGADSITTGANCTAQGAKKATCTAPAGAPKITDVDAELLDGNDTFDLAGANGDADGGAGNDTLRGGELSDVLRGGTGTDDLRGDGGSDTLSDGDVTGQSVNKDTIDGGPANDFVDYTRRTATVTVDLADDAGDGESGENDALSGIENVAGGLAADAIRGDANVNVLQGAGGDDTVEGRDGNDRLYGSMGRDTLVGGAGSDDMESGEDDDTIRPENPAGQFDRLITCGPGKDTIVGIGPRPSVSVQCELGDFGFGFVAGLKPKKVTMDTVTVKVPCPDAFKRDGACKGSIVVEPTGAYARSDADRRKQRYGAKEFRITGPTKVSVRLNSAGRRELRKSAFKLQFTINLKETATKTKRRFEWTSYLVRSFL